MSQIDKYVQIEQASASAPRFGSISQVPPASAIYATTVTRFLAISRRYLSLRDNDLHKIEIH
jgi:hypothetical protein